MNVNDPGTLGMEAESPLVQPSHTSKYKALIKLQIFNIREKYPLNKSLLLLQTQYC